MYRNRTVAAVIPALNEERGIAAVVRGLLALHNADGSRIIDDVVVCDNGSRDTTVARAEQAGARVVHEEQVGYGCACLAAVRALNAPDVILFTDGDHAFKATEATRLLDCIGQGADLAVGSRTLGRSERGALTRGQIIGNRVASLLILLLWGQRVTDLGPYRAIRSEAFDRLNMEPTPFGWTVEMQVKAIQHGLKTVEVPVDTRRRTGKSKISGTLRGAAGAGIGILSTIMKLRWRQHL